MLTGAALMAVACGAASANSIFSVAGSVTFTTDGGYTLNLAKFNVAGATLTGATMYFYGAENVSQLELTNSAAGVQTFDLVDQSNLNQGSGNSANAADKYTGEVLDMFDTGIGPGLAQQPVPEHTLTLGGSATPVCAEFTPNASCSDVSYTPPNLFVQNIDAVYGFTTGVGLGGVDGVIKNIVGGDLANYVGAGTFALSGATKNLTTFSGGGGNINLGIATNATFNAEIDYTYTFPSGTPEPTTMALMGGALLGLGFLGKRFKKS
jgi:hypothetical protein